MDNKEPVVASNPTVVTGVPPASSQPINQPTPTTASAPEIVSPPTASEPPPFPPESSSQPLDPWSQSAAFQNQAQSMPIGVSDGQTSPPPPIIQQAPLGQVPTGTTPPPIEEKKSSSKIPVILGFVVLVIGIAVAGGYYFMTNRAAPVPTPEPTPVVTLPPLPTATPDSTLTWKTYTNENYKFTFKYPETLVLAGNAKVVNPVKLNFELKETDTSLFAFSLYQMDKTNLYDWVIDHGPDGKSGRIYFPSASNIKSSTLGTLSTVEFEDMVSGTTIKTQTTVFSQNNLAYTFQLLGQTGQQQEAFTRVLSTFRFVEPSPSASPTGSPKASPTASPSASF